MFRFRCSSIQFNLAVGDENDNAPLFTDEVTRLSIVENISIGTAIATVTATDLDAPEKFGLISYSLSGLGSADFNIDPESGQITVSQTIDYESQSSYNVSDIHLSISEPKCQRIRFPLYPSDKRQNHSLNFLFS